LFAFFGQVHGALWFHPDDEQNGLPRQVDLYLRKGHTDIDVVLDRVQEHPLLSQCRYAGDPSELMLAKPEGKHLSAYNLKLPLAMQANATVGYSRHGDENVEMTHAWLRFDKGLTKFGCEEKRHFAVNLFLNIFGFKAITSHGVGDGPHGPVPPPEKPRKWVYSSHKVWKEKSPMPALPASKPPPPADPPLPPQPTRDTPGKHTSRKRTTQLPLAPVPEPSTSDVPEELPASPPPPKPLPPPVESPMPVLPASPPADSDPPPPPRPTRNVPGEFESKRAALPASFSPLAPVPLAALSTSDVPEELSPPPPKPLEQPLAQSLPQAAEEPQQEHGLPLAPLPRADAPSTSDVPEESPASSSLEPLQLRLEDAPSTFDVPALFAQDRELPLALRPPADSFSTWDVARVVFMI